MGIETGYDPVPSFYSSSGPMRLNFPMGIETRTTETMHSQLPSRPMRLNFPMGIETTSGRGKGARTRMSNETQLPNGN